MKKLLPIVLFWLSSLAFAQCAPGESCVYYHFDHLGAPIAATDDAGKLKWSRDYSAFGKTFGAVDVSDRIGFAGQEYDTATELSYMGARWYDPKLGRFLTSDPVRFVDSNTLSFNRYLYANNSPYTYNDPDGEFFDLAIEILSISLSVHSAYKNFSEGNYGDALMDVGSIVLDATLMAVPGVPGGVGVLRHADEAAAAVKAICSFEVGTPVHTPAGLINIEDIVQGQTVWSKSDLTYDLAAKPVARTFRSVHTDDVIELIVRNSKGDSDRIVTTAEHPFFVEDKGWLTAQELTLDHQLYTLTDEYIEMEAITWLPVGQYDTYNFAVDEYSTYGVGKFGVWTHNSKVCDLLGDVVDKVGNKGSRPPNLSPDGAGLNGAFREAKR